MSNKRIEYIKQKNPNIPSDVIDSLVLADPTKEKKFLVWIVRLYINGSINDSTLSKTKVLLEAFEKNKIKLPQEIRDINKFNNLLDLSFLLMKFERDNRKSEESFLKSGIRKIYEDERWLVAVPLTVDAAIKMGKGTTWCTSSINYKYNHFYSYARKGELFVVIDKSKKDNSQLKKLQLFFNYDGSQTEFRNASNNPIDIIKLFKENKEVLSSMSECESVKGHLIDNAEFFALIKNPTKKQKLQAISKSPDSIKYMDNVDEEMIEMYLDFCQYDDSDVFAKKFKTFNKFSDNSIIQALEVNLSLINHIQESGYTLSPEAQMTAVEEDVECIGLIKNPLKDTIDYVLESVPEFILKIKNPTSEQQVAAVNGDADLIMAIKNPSKKAIIEAVKCSEVLFKKFKDVLSEKNIMNIVSESPFVIEHIIKPSEKVQIAAIKSNFDVISHIKNPTKLVKLLVESKKIEHEQFLENTIKAKNKDYGNWGNYDIYNDSWDYSRRYKTIKDDNNYW